MTRSQQIHLMTLWQRACKAQGWDARNEQRRHDLYAELLGQPKRFSEFTNRDFDRVKAAILTLDDNVQGAVELDRPEIGRCRRLLWKIKRFPLAYATALARDKFCQPDVDRLNEEQLTQLLVTLTARQPRKPTAVKTDNEPF